ncbi:UDP-N-acetyl-alpha-D-muramoyl-L-alanyl-L-glutamate epimerase [Luteimonas abyssi]|uniref:UDP-N-acetyl-alpha-D-muramoyl-L-alanyl-L- glutamate epimerase n=1 Tax=Luteimonas abyssi TaxID=1247514 RepID=UPI000737D70B|nr:UDP-N-acetyl-alpha-D-muramoyl-L-alanyl-L-glutamate epimerase [Luteimonas abyssi]
MSAVFDREAVRSFRFVDCGFDAATGVARLVYAFDDGPELVETVTVPGAPFALDDARVEAVQAATRLLHLIAGVSYYKAAVPEDIRIDGYAIDAATAALLDDIYIHGLGEFAYRNGLDLHGRVRFPVGEGASSSSALRAPSSSESAVPADSSPAGGRRASEAVAGGDRASLGLRAHALVAIGGGKDSLVSIEALREAGVAQTVTWIGGSQLIRACAERTGLPTLNIQRQLAPELFDYNRQGAWNGHIPVTAINSAILALAALVLDVDQVVFSNERSASYGSLIEGTGEVNHQWSKGWAFERAFGAHLRQHVAADLRYYSLLRPLSELAVARQFAKTDRYDAHFSSCNRNFHLLGERPVNRWCGVCPKCHFVFLALAPFMPKPRLVGIFGRNLLDDPAQTAGYDALLEYRDHKPFECVGEARESRAALAALGRRPEWREDALVQRFAQDIAPQLDAGELDIAPLLVLDDEHQLPPALWDRLRAHFDA